MGALENTIPVIMGDLGPLKADLKKNWGDQETHDKNFKELEKQLTQFVPISQLGGALKA